MLTETEIKYCEVYESLSDYEGMPAPAVSKLTGVPPDAINRWRRGNKPLALSKYRVLNADWSKTDDEIMREYGVCRHTVKKNRPKGSFRSALMRGWGR